MKEPWQIWVILGPDGNPRWFGNDKAEAWRLAELALNSSEGWLEEEGYTCREMEAREVEA